MALKRIGLGMMLLAGSLITDNWAGATKISVSGGKWRINGQATHAGSPAEGLLMNVRMINTTFEDIGPKAPKGFNPDANTAAFIAKLPSYAAEGILAFSVGLQGGFPGYEGAHNSAFESNGALRSSYMARVALVIEAADRAGTVVILGCFYQRQHKANPTYNPKALSGKTAIQAAVRNTATWIKDKGYGNVLLEITNEYPHTGYLNWKDGAWLMSSQGQVELIQLAQSTRPGLLVSTSGLGSISEADNVAKASNFIILHANNASLSEYVGQITKYQSYGKPLLINEDDKLGSAAAEAAQLSVKAGAGWGFMHKEKNQFHPFIFSGPADDKATYAAIKALTGGGGTVPTPADLSVMLTGMSDGKQYQEGEGIPLSVEVVTPTGVTVKKMEFLANDKVIATLTASPWSKTVTLAPGKYILKARATGSDGKTGISGSADIEVLSKGAIEGILPLPFRGGRRRL